MDADDVAEDSRWNRICYALDSHVAFPVVYIETWFSFAARKILRWKGIDWHCSSGHLEELGLEVDLQVAGFALDEMLPSSVTGSATCEVAVNSHCCDPP